ncbi:unnamed protein product [Pylaiella littoralis]
MVSRRRDTAGRGRRCYNIGGRSSSTSSALPPLLLLAFAGAAALVCGSGDRSGVAALHQPQQTHTTTAQKQQQQQQHQQQPHRRHRRRLSSAATAWVAPSAPPVGIPPPAGRMILCPRRASPLRPQRCEQRGISRSNYRHLRHAAATSGGSPSVGSGSRSGAGGRVGCLLATTTTPDVPPGAGAGAAPGATPSESEEGPTGSTTSAAAAAAATAAAATAVFEDGAAGSGQQQVSALFSNDTAVLPAVDHPQLVSDVLDIVASSMPSAPIALPEDTTAVVVAAAAATDAAAASAAAPPTDVQARATQRDLTAFFLHTEICFVCIYISRFTANVGPEHVYGEKNSRAMVTELVAFTLPLLVVWLSNPIMSLVDTAVVGAKSSVELAALGPGTSLCDNLAYMCGFLAQVTTNLGASALASGDSLKADRATRTGMFVGMGAGVGVSYVLLMHGRALLQLFLGGNAAVASVLPYSSSYVYIRALGFVAVTLSMVLQSAYLARKDIATPIKSVAGSAVVNLLLDCIAVFVFGMGIKGAALSTTVAQWVGLLYLVKEFWPDFQKSGKVSFFPYRSELKAFLQLGAPTCLALSGQVATCIAVTVAASGCDTVALAAHQVIYGVFLLFCPIGEAVSQTVQTYLPGFTVQRPPSADGTPRKTLTFGKSAVRMIKVISTVALGLGAVNAALAFVLTTCLPYLFTPDRAVWAAMRSVSVMCATSLSLYGIAMAFQGAMMATREVYPTAAIYTLCSVVFSTKFVMMRRSPSLKLTSVWAAFWVYQVTRCVMFAATVGWSHRVSLREGLFSDDDSSNVQGGPDGEVAVAAAPAAALAAVGGAEASTEAQQQLSASPSSSSSSLRDSSRRLKLGSFFESRVSGVTSLFRRRNRG